MKGKEMSRIFLELGYFCWRNRSAHRM